MRSLDRLMAAATATLTVVGLAGCVSLPASGRVSDIQVRPPVPNGPGQVILVPSPPSPDWNPVQVVTGFLAASGSLLSGGSTGQSAVSSESLTVARDYLAPWFRRQWKPGSPTIIGSNLAELSITRQHGPLHVVPGLSYVAVTSDHVGTLQRAGNIHAGNIIVSATKHVFEFGLYETPSGQWLIDSLPGTDPRHPLLLSHLLLLTQSDFLRDYQPRDLYFISDSDPDALVPYPVFIPAQAQTQAGAQELANDLLKSVPGGTNGSGPPGSLSGATTTAFPPGAKISSVEVSGVKATVTLDLPASARPTGHQIEQMEAQLVWTLTSSPYDGVTSGIGSVQLVIRGGPSTLLLPRQFSWLPSVGVGSLYFQTPGAAGRPVIESRGASGSTTPVPTPAGLGTGLLTAIAVSQAHHGPAMLGACRGRTVYLAQLRSRARAIRQSLSADCTALTWDGSGNLWVASGATFHVCLDPLRSGSVCEKGQNMNKSALGPVNHNVNGAPSKLNIGLMLPASDKVTAFQVAPDGVRVAMIVRSETGGRVFLKVFVAAISANSPYRYLAQNFQKVEVGSDIADPVALAWQGPDDLLVLGARTAGGTQRYVYQVPLNGEPSVRSSVALPPGAQWLTANGLGVVAVGRQARSAGRMWLLPTWDGEWQQPAIMGSTPAYSG